MYKKLAGMTGTAETEARRVRQDLQARSPGHPDQPADASASRIPTSSTAPSARSSTRWRDEIEELHETGQPVLVGTISIEKSEQLADAAQEGAASSTSC